MIGLSINNVSDLTPSATDKCANPVSEPIYKSQFLIIGKVSLILSSSKDLQFFPTSEFFNLFIKSISFFPPAI